MYLCVCMYPCPSVCITFNSADTTNQARIHAQTLQHSILDCGMLHIYIGQKIESTHKQHGALCFLLQCYMRWSTQALEPLSRYEYVLRFPWLVTNTYWDSHGSLRIRTEIPMARYEYVLRFPWLVTNTYWDSHGSLRIRTEIPTIIYPVALG